MAVDTKQVEENLGKIEDTLFDFVEAVEEGILLLGTDSDEFDDYGSLLIEMKDTLIGQIRVKMRVLNKRLDKVIADQKNA
jgi:hypothetical protein